MPKNKELNGQGTVSDEEDEIEVGSCQEIDTSGRRNQDGVGSANGGGGNDSLYNRNKTNSSRDSRRNKRKTESQFNLSLGAWTKSANDAVQRMSETERAIRTLSDSYKQHVDDIQKFTTIQQRLSELEQDCRDKDDKIKKQEDGIEALGWLNQKKEDELQKKREDIDVERKVLEEEKKSFKKSKETAEKRIRAQEAEQEHRQAQELERLKLEQEEKFTQKMKELEKQKKKLEDENKEVLADLEADKNKLSEELEAEKNKATEKEVALEKAEAKFDDLRRVTDSYKNDTKELRAKLKAMENEFGLDSQGVESYEKRFNDILRGIEEISARYFKELSCDDLDAARNALKAADSCFASVPISNSEDSRLLRIANVQRVISGFLCDIVWQPFSSEQTLQYPDLMAMLNTIAAQVAKSNHGSSAGGRAETVWSALTMRALQSLQPTSPSASNSTSQRSATPDRAEKLVSDVLRVLGSLVDPDQETQLRNDLATLTHSAISTWSCAQTDELELTVCPTLDLANLAEWRSIFDDGNTTEIISSTRPRIFTLFPRITAKKFLLTVKTPTGPPGSWPELEDQKLCTLETCIHPGIGLRECSPLVTRGKDEEDQRRAKEDDTKKRIQEFAESLKKESWKPQSKRNELNSRSGSVVGLGIGSPTSPSAQWGSNLSIGRKHSWTSP